jgi:hypothetical protein
VLDDIEHDAGEFLGEGQEIIATSEKRGFKDDLTKLRKRAKEAEETRDEYKEALDAGDSVNKSKAEKLQIRVDELEPVIEELTGVHREIWKAAEESIPDNLQKRFRKPKEGEELSVGDLVHNVRRLNEYREDGIIEGAPTKESGDEDPPPTPPGAPRVTNSAHPKKLTKEQLEKLPSAEKMEAGYKPAKAAPQ